MADILIGATTVIDATNNHLKAVRYVDELVSAKSALTRAQVPPKC